jgi:hypothetical protein
MSKDDYFLKYTYYMSIENPTNEEENQEDGEKKRKPYHDDHFLGNHEDVLPKTYNQSEQTEELLKKRAFDRDAEIERIHKLVIDTISKEIEAGAEKANQKMDAVLKSFYTELDILEKEAEQLPKWQEYKKFAEKIPRSYRELENTMSGSLRRLWHLFTFGTEGSWWKKAQKIIEEKVREAEEKKKIAMEEYNSVFGNKIQQLENKKDEELSQILEEMGSYDAAKKTRDEIRKREETQKLLRDPKNLRGN